MPHQIHDFSPERFRAICRSRHVDKVALAAMSGVSLPAIHSWQRGDTRPTVLSLRMVARALGVPLADFLDPSPLTLLRMRLDRALSQQEVARVAGITVSTVSRLECATGALTADAAARLARVYRVPVGDIQAAHAAGRAVLSSAV